MNTAGKLGPRPSQPSRLRASTSAGNKLAQTFVYFVCFVATSLPSLVAGVFYPEAANTLHFAFEGSPNGDRPIIRPPAFYQAEDGFGFVNSPTLIGTSRGVTAPKYFRFDVNLPAGTYDISVTLGGTKDESITAISAEGQPMVRDIHVGTERDAKVVKTFTVTVKRGPASDTSLAGDGRLNLEFEGTNPSMMKLDIKPSAAR